MSGRPGVIKLRPAPHVGQQQLLATFKEHRFLSACCGRRFGKTLVLLMLMMLLGINKPGMTGWWVDAIHYLAKRAFRMMLKVVLANRLQSDYSKSELRIELITGSVIEFHSAERADKLRGEGLDLACLNEASLMKQSLWDEILYPMLTDKGGKAVFAYTPKGMGHWTYRNHQWGLSDDPERADYGAISLPTSANPIIRPEFITAARRDLPDQSFRQEYLAEFLPDSSGVFRNILACVGGVLDRPQIIPTAGPYVGGLDLAKHNDFTVLFIIDALGRVCWHDRFHRMDWPAMKERVIKAAGRYKAHLLVESNSIGDVVIDDLRAAGVNVTGFATTGQSKQGLIQGLMVALEQNLISFPSIPELLTELQIFEYERMPGGAVRYQAPEGAHDDEVMALALAVKAFRDMGGPAGRKWLDLDPEELEAEEMAEAA